MKHSIDVIKEGLGIEHAIIIAYWVYQHIVIVARKVVQAFGYLVIQFLFEIDNALFLAHVLLIDVERKDRSIVLG